MEESVFESGMENNAYKSGLVNHTGPCNECNNTSCCYLDSLDCLSHNFLWGSTLEKKKKHLLAGNKICQPKDEVGVGC